MARDLHQSLRTDVLGTANGGGLRLTLTRQQWGKDDVSYSLHASPSSFSFSGVQRTDMLGFLGFERTACPFHNGSAYCAEADGAVDVAALAVALGESYDALVASERGLQACGHALPQPEGWGHFLGGRSGGRVAAASPARGDGHTTPARQRMKETEDDSFGFVLTWIEGGADKGWTTHYRAKHPPVSPEVAGAFALLGLREFATCPEFDFDACYWRFHPFLSEGVSRFAGAEHAHDAFDAHASQFSVSVERLLHAHRVLEPFGMRLLPIPQSPTQRNRAAIEGHGAPVAPRQEPLPEGLDQGRMFDVAISFAGTERTLAEELALRLQERSVEVFYDSFYPADLWGKDLAVFFDEIYRKRSRFCVVLVSEEYVKREWTNHERRSAQARALQAKGDEYILPIMVDDSELPGLPPTIGHVSLREHSIDSIAGLVASKLRSMRPRQ